MKSAVDESTFRRLFSSSDIESLRGEFAVVRVASEAAAGKLGREYRALVERSLSQAAGRTVSVRFIVADEPAAPAAVDVEPTAARYVISLEEAERGRQLWTAALATLGTCLSAADVARLSAVTPLGQGPDGSLLLGVPNRLAGRLLEGRGRSAVEDGLAGVLGTRYPLHIVERADWSIS
jgi:hypothetical protein